MKHRRKQGDAPQTLSFSLVRRRPDRLRELDRCARLVDKVPKARDLEVGYEAHAKTGGSSTSMRCPQPAAHPGREG
jgi:hypothetical protein